MFNATGKWQLDAKIGLFIIEFSGHVALQEYTFKRPKFMSALHIK